MSAKNNCSFVGNIGRDCAARHTQSGTAVASFPIAIESGYGDKKATSWVRCTIFGKRAESGLVQYLVKGQQVAVMGEIKLNQYQDKDGNDKSSLDMNVSDIALIGEKKGEVKHRSPEPKEYAKPVDKTDPFATPEGSDTNEDIPFN